MKASPAKRYVRGFLVTVITVLLLTAALNTTVNPLRVTPVPWSLDRLDAYRVVEHYERTAKAGYVRNSDWDDAFFGSSRIDLGLNPDHPAFAGRRVVNLALSAGRLNENVAMLRYTLEHEKLGLVVFGVDLTDLAEPVVVAKTDFYSSPLSAGNPLDRELQYLFGLTALKGTFTTLARASRGIPSEHLPNGHWVWSRPPLDLRRDAQRKALPQAFGLSRRRSAAFAPLNPEKVALAREVIHLCRNAGSRLVFVLPPNHAVRNAAFFLLDDPDPDFAAERRFLTELIAEDNLRHPDSAPFALWDFDDFHPFNCEPLPTSPDIPLNDWFDMTHSSPSLGILQIEAFLGEQPSRTADGVAYGRMLTPETINEALAARRAGFSTYRNANAHDIAWIESTLADLRAGASAMLIRPDE